MTEESSAALELRRGNRVAMFSLLTSASTLVCCALPALLVTLGAGAALVSLTSAVPQLIWLSEHKAEVFVLAGAMLAAAGLLQWQARRLPCPTDPALAQRCTKQRMQSAWIYRVSVLIYAVGVFFAYLAPVLLI